MRRRFRIISSILALVFILTFTILTYSSVNAEQLSTPSEIGYSALGTILTRPIRPSSFPLPIPQRPNIGCISIVAGGDHTVGLLNDGSVSAIGNNIYGQCNTTAENGFTDIVAIDAGDYFTVGLKSDGTVVAVGDNSWGQCNTTVENGFVNIVAIAAGFGHVVGLKSDGTIVAVGMNSIGQCNTTVANGFTDIVAIDAGNYHTVGLKSDGTVVAVGSYSGCNTTAENGFTNIVAIAAGGNDTHGLKIDGTVISIGANSNGQSDTTVANGFSNLVAIKAGNVHTVGLKNDGTVVAVGGNLCNQCNTTVDNGFTDIVAISAGGEHTVGLKSDGIVIAIGLNTEGQCNVSQSNIFTNIVNLKTTHHNMFGLRSDGKVAVVSDNNDYGEANVTEANGFSNIVAIAVDDVRTVGLKNDGTVVAVGWNDHGECNTTTQNGFSDILAISTGIFHTVGLKRDGTVVAVGNNSWGQCNTTAEKGFTDIIAISAGSYHTVGLKRDGTVVAVGDNTNGECNTTVENGFVDVVAIAVDLGITVGLKRDGTVVATGHNEYGQCNTSVQNGFVDIVAIDIENNHTVGLKRDGTVVSIGYNQFGQCNTTEINGFKDIKAISAGFGHTVGLKNDGTVIAVGLNDDNQCDTSTSKGFFNVVGIDVFKGYETIGLKSDGTVLSQRCKYSFVNNLYCNNTLTSPTIISPLENSTLDYNSPVISWTSVQNAQYYKVALVDIDTGEKFINDEFVYNTQLDLSKNYSDKLINGHKYNIAIGACAEGYSEGWTLPQPYYFTINSRIIIPTLQDFGGNYYIPYGDQFTLPGKITSEDKITKVTAGILGVTDNIASAEPLINEFDLSNLVIDTSKLDISNTNDFTITLWAKTESYIDPREPLGLIHLNVYTKVNGISEPSNMIGTAVSESRVDLCWDKVGIGVLYKIYYSGTRNGEYSQIGETDSNIFSCIGLAGNTHWFKIKSVYNNNESSFSLPICVVTGKQNSYSYSYRPLVYLYDGKTPQYSDIIDKYAKQYNIDPNLICSIIETESHFNANALSPAGAKGLMQMMPGSNAQKYGLFADSDFYNPDKNISAGVHYMHDLVYTTWKDAVEGNRVKLALASFNAGTYSVNEWVKAALRANNSWNVPLYQNWDIIIDYCTSSETKGYVDPIYNRWITTFSLTMPIAYITSPPNGYGTVINDITVTWTAVQNVKEYVFSVAEITSLNDYDNDGLKIYNEIVSGDTNSFTISKEKLKPGMKYRLGVCPIFNDGTEGNWNLSSFYIYTSKPLITNPVNNAFVTDDNILIKWEDVIGACHYNLAIADITNPADENSDNAPQVVKLRDNGLNTSFLISAELLSDNHKYRIYVEAADANNNLQWQVSNFTYENRKNPSVVSSYPISNGSDFKLDDTLEVVFDKTIQAGLYNAPCCQDNIFSFLS